MSDYILHKGLLDDTIARTYFNCQDNYLHTILAEKQVVEPRISLTFRLVAA